MSTSDPSDGRPPTAPPVETPPVDTPPETPTDAPADTASETGPDDTTTTSPAVTPASPSGATPPVEPRDTDLASTETGRHATVRPAPTPPDPVDPATTATLAPTGTYRATRPAASPVATEPAPATAPEPAQGTATGTAPGTTYPPPITPEPPVEDGRLFPEPNAPRTPTFGTHVLGVIVGLILGPIAVGGVLLGQSRILAAQTDHWDASFDLLGIVLISAGLLLLGCVLLLALWTSAVPITAGLVLGALGGFYLYAPGVARRETLHFLTTQGWHTQVTQVTVVGTSGTLLVAGFLVLLGGLVAAGVRRRGVHLGEFRERNRA